MFSFPDKISTRARLWRKTLYFRSLFFMLVGSACLFGAVIAQSWITINGMVERLLDERITLARTIGNYLDQAIEADCVHLTHSVSDLVPSGPAAAGKERLRAVLTEHYRKTIFDEGVFVLDNKAALLVAVPEMKTIDAIDPLIISSLVDKARPTTNAVSSSLITLRPGNRRVLIFVQAIRGSNGEIQGFVGGILHSATNNLLRPFQNVSSLPTGTFQLVDSMGSIVATTNPNTLFQVADHENILRDAISAKREFSGRCHNCHENGKNAPNKETTILAFAPLPTIGLGMAVLQNEEEALAPALRLKARVFLLGFAFIAIFLVFAALSVHGVVSPLIRLTHAVRAADETERPLSLPSFGDDEVGELAQALNRWRGRVFEALEQLTRQEAKLQAEIISTQNHLSALQQIAEISLAFMSPKIILQKGLEKLTELMNAASAALVFVHGTHHDVSCQGMTTEETEHLSQKIGEVRRKLGFVEDTSVFGWVQIHSFETKRDFADFTFSFNQLVVAEFVPKNDRRLQCFFGNCSWQTIETNRNRLESLLHQIFIGMSNSLLNEQNILRHKESQTFLDGVLRAQEEERRRVARELHDTIAQELAAHRLEIERLTNVKIFPGAEELLPKLHDLETHAQSMMTSVRQLLLDLRPAVLDDLGFLPALQWYMERVEREKKIKGTLIIDGERRPIDHQIEMSLFRIFQESLNNVIQHAQAEQVIVTVSFMINMIELTMEDDGKGFDLAADDTGKTRSEGGLGILGMKERSSLLGGEFSINSQLGDGTTVIVRIPITSGGTGGEIDSSNIS